MPPDPSTVPIDIVGDLHKLGRVFKTWVKRYFEVQGTKMYYYKSDQVCVCVCADCREKGVTASLVHSILHDRNWFPIELKCVMFRS